MAIRLEFKADSKQAENSLYRMQRSVNKIDTNVQKTTKSLRGLATTAKLAASAFAAIYSVKALTRTADNFINIENRIALVTGRTKELRVAFVSLQAISRETRTSLTGTADLFSKIARSVEGAYNQEQLITTVKAIQQAIVISGSTAESADAAIVQLGQGLAAGALRGQELNSVMEQTQRVAKAIADSLGIGLGQLREIAQQGKLNSDVVMQAFLDQAEAINAEFAQLDATFGQSFLRLGEELGFIFSEF
ncbi:MAG: hypothetical protein DRQ35_06910, partial [Gammaproteobacteria bacterium]